ncbi:Rossmann-like alpha/beta/alpha sandwich [Corchorus olitorius]|uniref:Cytoplasmic tRNA 2-thiolation protein 2 n=1 Tax=Corchorus olitorius TaxID=93759 RepID=A0A1R3HLY8_9ROSI|nr:Rossmann-like alpha/beta/alpha sandwich [Corchorus olitorius]
MACNSATCNSSGCYKEYAEEQRQPTTRNNGSAAAQKNLCVKCKSNEPVCCGIAGDDARFCKDCFKTNLYGKFKQAVSYNALITPSDKVLVAFSGGPSSRVGLQFVHEMQCRAQNNYDASKDKSLPVFGVGVAFIDESSVHSFTSIEIEKAIEDIRSIVSNLSPPEKELYVVPSENIFSSDSIEGKEKLKKLVDGVSDVTGKEDLLVHLRMLALQKVASENGYTRVVLGTCTSRIACHVISATVKGQGYSLSADIQYVDSRWEIPVVLPLRDCPAQELNTLCSLDGLEIVELINGPCSSINGLVSSFVKVLQEENPSRECTIVRTAGKLTPFHFNRIPDIHDSNIPSATRKRLKRQSLNPNGSISSESFCPICNSPLNKSNFSSSLSNLESDQISTNFAAACCSSCQFQILPKDPSLMEQFVSLLPQPLIARAKRGDQGDFRLLREQIQDFLLSDGCMARHSQGDKLFLAIAMNPDQWLVPASVPCH